MFIRNFTPHTINIILTTGELSIPSEGVARCASTTKQVGVVSDPTGEHIIPINKSELGEVEGLPKEEEGTILVVSQVVANHPSMVGRTDLVYPGSPVCDANDVVVGYHGLNAGVGLASKF